MKMFENNTKATAIGVGIKFINWKQKKTEKVLVFLLLELLIFALILLL